MPTMLDVFNQDAFSLISMSAAIQKLPYQEMRLGQMGLFDFSEGVETDTVMIDRMEGQIQVLGTRPRGSEPEQAKKEKKSTSLAVKIPHLQFEDRILAASLFGKRQPGEAFLQSVARKVNDRLAWMRGQVENTWEVHRLNALQGKLLDSDGSTILDMFALFGGSQTTHTYTLTSSTFDVRGKTIAALRLIEAVLGGVPYREVRAICGATFFDKLVSHPAVRETYLNQDAAAANVLRADLRKAGFSFGGVIWEEYRGMSGLTDDIGVVDPDEAVMFPIGVPNMYRTYWAPGDFIETVNTTGIPMYAKAAPDEKYNRWVDLLVETNPLYINTRPKAVLRITKN